MLFWLTFNLIDSSFSCIRHTFISHQISKDTRNKNCSLFVREKSFFQQNIIFKISSIYIDLRHDTICWSLKDIKFFRLKLFCFFFLLHQKTSMIKFYFYFIWRKGNHYIWVLIWKDVDRDKFLLYLLLECIDLFFGMILRKFCFHIIYVYVCI